MCNYPIWNFSFKFIELQTHEESLEGLCMPWTGGVNHDLPWPTAFSYWWHLPYSPYSSALTSLYTKGMFLSYRSEFQSSEHYRKLLNQILCHMKTVLYRADNKKDLWKALLLPDKELGPFHSCLLWQILCYAVNNMKPPRSMPGAAAVSMWSQIMPWPLATVGCAKGVV